MRSSGSQWQRGYSESWYGKYEKGETMSQAERRRGRLQLLLIAALFLGPLIGAAWMYYSGSDLAPKARSNHGVLLEPIRPLAEAHPDLPALSPGKWLLIYAHGGRCDDPCRESLYTLRQSRLMLGNEMNRLVRVFLHDETATDKVPPDEQQDGLRSTRNWQLAQDLRSALPQTETPGGFFLVDPLGNLVMYFPSNLGPREMVDDIKHLLKLSRIG
jgi:hypothetical protein